MNKLTTDQEFGEQLTFYADWHGADNRRTGLNAQFVTTRRGELALAIEVAPILRAGQAPDWPNKITVHLSMDELAEFCAVLLGCMEQAQALYHGDSRNKGIQVRARPGIGGWIGLSQAGRNLQFVLSSTQRMSLCAFALRRLSQMWLIPVQSAIEIIRAADPGAE